MTPDERKALREAAEKALNGERAERCSIVPVPPASVLSLLDALEASEAKLGMAREALKPFAERADEYDSPDCRRAAATLKEITEP